VSTALIILDTDLAAWIPGAMIGASATVIGAVIGNQLGDPRRYGLDAAAAAAFLALVWPRLRRARPRAVAGVAALVALVLVPVAPAGVPVLAAAVVGVLGAWRPE